MGIVRIEGSEGVGEMIDIIGFFKGLASSNDRKQFLYSNIYNQIYILLSRKHKFIGNENAIYHLDKYFYLADQAINEYDYSDIRETDIVLDIGACVGGFSLEVHKKVDHIYSIEPLFTDELCENIRLNHAKNIAVFEYALGKSDTTQEISFVGKTRDMWCKSLSELICLCGGHVDILKLDCEGGEWCIEPHELEGIRRIEAEIHSFNGERTEDFTDMLLSLDYDVQILNRSKHTQLLSARRR